MLHPLSEAPGGLLRARELGTEIGWDRSRLSHHLSRMEKRGLVAREECAEDGRGLMVRLTDAGRQAIEERHRRTSRTSGATSSTCCRRRARHARRRVRPAAREPPAGQRLLAGRRAPHALKASARGRGSWTGRHGRWP